MTLPSRHLLIALTIWLALAIAAAVLPALQIWGFAAGAVLLLWALPDCLLAYALALPAVQRVVNGTLAVGEWSPVEMRLHWPNSVPAQFEVFDHHPLGFAQEGLPVRIRTAGKNSFALRYHVRALLRGDHRFAQVELRIVSPWRAWLRQVSVGEIQEVRVYPNFAPLARHALHAVDYRNARFGLQQRRRRGQGMDFAQLREYREGDSMRQIDWKATTRMGKMISREYQDERDQRIMLLIDCGRRMGARESEPAQTPSLKKPEGRHTERGASRPAHTESDGLSHFDHALDAVLMLAYVALNHGDRVGLMTLGGPERYLPAQHAASTVSHILRETYDLQPSLQVSDFEQAAERLLAHERKRALVVLLTNLRDEDDQGLLAAARLLGKRHLLLVASLRESALEQAQAAPIHDAHDAAGVAAALGYARRRETLLRRLRAEGVLCLDVTPEDLAIETVNRYLAIKAAKQL